MDSQRCGPAVEQFEPNLNLVLLFDRQWQTNRGLQFLVAIEDATRECLAAVP
jgi:hypothetical protein